MNLVVSEESLIIKLFRSEQAFYFQNPQSLKNMEFAGPEFDDDDQILLVEIERSFLHFYDFLGKSEAFKLFQKFRQTTSSITNPNKRKLVLIRKLDILKNDASRGTHQGICRTSIHF